MAMLSVQTLLTTSTKNMSLPWELVLEIVKLVLDDIPRHPTPLILVNSTFQNLCLSILHTELRFRSVQQLEDFTSSTTSLTSYPRSLSISLAGGTADFRLFKLLHGVFRHCLKLLTERPPQIVSEALFYNSFISPTCLHLKRVYFHLNSHTSDENCRYLQDAINLIDPEEFTWVGPDPGHHFSIAIVPIAVFYLFRGMQSWTKLRHLKLTNLAFPLTPSLTFNESFPRAFGLVSALNKAPTDDGSQSTFTPLSHLESIYLGQMTFVYPAEIALIACAPELKSLQSIHVVDVYQGSIWGPRVRRIDVENAIAHLYLQALDNNGSLSPVGTEFRLEEHLLRARDIVQCEGKNERIIGGDRMDAATRFYHSCTKFNS